MTSETEPVNPTMLLSCARDNNVQGIRRLVTERNIPVDYGNVIGQTALHIAALHGNVEAVVTLLYLALQTKIPNFVNIQNQRGQTPLHFAAAAKKNALQLCNILLDADADPFLDDSMGRLPYETTLDPVIKKLLGGPDPRIFSIAGSGDIRAMKAFFEEFPDHEVAVFDGEGNAPLHYAVAGNHLGVISYLVGERGAFINMQNIDHGDTALHIAVANADNNPAALTTLNLLTRLGADPNQCNFNTNQYADGTWASGTEIVSPLDKAPLHLAVETGNSDAVEKLLAIPGINVNVEDAAKETPLHYAVEMQDDEVLEMLLESGRCDVGKRSKSHASAVHAAASSGWAVGLKMMLESYYKMCVASLEKEGGGGGGKGGEEEEDEASVAVRELINIDDDGWTPLMLAVRGGKVKAAQLLLKMGADPLFTNPKTGATVYHLAAVNGREDMCKVLVSATEQQGGGKEWYKEGLKIRNKDGALPAEVAKTPVIAELFSVPL